MKRSRQTILPIKGLNYIDALNGLIGFKYIITHTNTITGTHSHIGAQIINNDTN